MTAELWILALVPVLAWILARMRTKRPNVHIHAGAGSAEHVSVEEMSQMVQELSPSLRPSTRVTSPNTLPESGHVWNSPSGKRVYMN